MPATGFPFQWLPLLLRADETKRASTRKRTGNTQLGIYPKIIICFLVNSQPPRFFLVLSLPFSSGGKAKCMGKTRSANSSSSSSSKHMASREISKGTPKQAEGWPAGRFFSRRVQKRLRQQLPPTLVVECCLCVICVCSLSVYCMGRGEKEGQKSPKEKGNREIRSVEQAKTKNSKGKNAKTILHCFLLVRVARRHRIALTAPY